MYGSVSQATMHGGANGLCVMKSKPGPLGLVPSCRLGWCVCIKCVAAGNETLFFFFYLHVVMLRQTSLLECTDSTSHQFTIWKAGRKGRERTMNILQVKASQFIINSGIFVFRIKSFVSRCNVHRTDRMNHKVFKSSPVILLGAFCTSCFKGKANSNKCKAAWGKCFPPGGTFSSQRHSGPWFGSTCECK